MPLANNRQQQLNKWLRQQPGMANAKSLSPLVPGTSSRQFFRFRCQHQSYVLMDAPPPKEDSKRYVDIAIQFDQQQINVPKIISHDHQQGFVLMSDLGEQLYWQVLNRNNADQLYQSAMQVLIKLQQARLSLPPFDTGTMMIGLNGFKQTFLQKYLKRPLSQAGGKILKHCFAQLITNALSQPQAPMHRDYHSQNLLLVENNQAGVVDFQDAKIGPITYDLVSLLRDCYIDWPPSQIDQYMRHFFEQLQQHQLLDSNVSLIQFQQWFDWIGIKRHLKACFTFARKQVEYHDSHYLQYLPRTLAYIHQSCQQYPIFKPFLDWFEQEVLAYMPATDS